MKDMYLVTIRTWEGSAQAFLVPVAEEEIIESATERALEEIGFCDQWETIETMRVGKSYLTELEECKKRFQEVTGEKVEDCFTSGKYTTLGAIEKELKEREKIMKFNTIRLLKGYATLTRSEYGYFKKGDTISGLDSNPVEVARWNISEESKALEELRKYHCEYRRGLEDYFIEEYALEYCACNSDGEFLEGSDYDFAEEEKELADFIGCTFEEIPENFREEILRAGDPIDARTGSRAEEAGPCTIDIAGTTLSIPGVLLQGGEFIVADQAVLYDSTEGIR